MKKFITFLVLLVLLQSCNYFTGNSASYSIVISNDSDSTTIKAANQLSKYWKKISGNKLEILSHPLKNKIPIYIQTQNLPKIKNDGFIISSSDTAVYLTGKTTKAALYAVNTLLEDYLGVFKFTGTEEFIPHKEKNILPEIHKIYNPDFDYRNVHCPGIYNESYRDWYKLESLDIWGMYVHTFNKLIPPEKYYKKHPEYYSLVNGRRLQDAQLCLSNPEVAELLIKNLRDTINKNPGKKYWSVSQNDTYNPCECENCQNLYKKYGGYSGAYVKTVNEVAKHFPYKIISTLAYQFTRHAPKNIKPTENVNIMLCTIECNRSKPLEKANNHNAFKYDLKDWSKLTDNIYLWDYVVQFRNFLTPFPNFPVLQPNIKFFKKYGTNMIFEQASGRNWSDLIELKQYLLAKLEWNTNVNVDSLAQRFINAYYGNAGKYIYSYYKTMNTEIKKHSDSQFLNIYGAPSDYINSFLTPDLMNYYISLMDSAEKAVSNDSILLNRVKRTRIPVDFSWVDIAVNNDFKTMPALVKTGNNEIVNPKIIELLNSMTIYTEKNKRIFIDEKGYSLKEYKKFVLNTLNLRLEPNKLKDAKIKLLKNSSNKYCPQKEKALNDGLFGPRSFSKNWLGFEGNDLVFIADFGKKTKISHIEINFLRDVNSWIFLPVSIKIEISGDGKHFKTISLKDKITTKHDFKVESVPFEFNFSETEMRYLKITATSIKTCPIWHRGYGKPSWIFTDEVIVN